MGVPAFFRWLSRKYPSIVTDAVEERCTDDSGKVIPVDCTKPNPNFQEFDALYLDMNGIIHPCTHPEDRPAPKNEEEMFALIYEYIDRLFAIVRPRKLLYMAIDGVAPRAKMNQQRSRRFRTSKEAAEKQEEVLSIRNKLEKKGVPLPPPKAKEEHFDSNCITPGTPFMARLAVALRHYINLRTKNDPAWQKIVAILSDANVPGEGEHKIMDFIRRQRSSRNHNPNTAHCLFGSDADLIMLGLATHEVNFNILREEFVPNKPRPCDLCFQYGHDLKDCQGLLSKNDTSDVADVADVYLKKTNFIFLNLTVLRRYLKKDLAMYNLPFRYDFERAIDDWIFLCFFVGNDFLPHLPSLKIREGAIDCLIKLYKPIVRSTKGWLTKNGEVVVERLQTLMRELGKVDNKSKLLPQSSSVIAPHAPSDGKQARQILNQLFTPLAGEDEDQPTFNSNADGWKDLYYREKFGVSESNVDFRRKVAWAYTEGLCWVLKYYYQGCVSWSWFYPYHYAPFASDFDTISKFRPDWSKNTKPFSQFEQLMAVLPPSSRMHVPEGWRDLMTSLDSPIHSLYPSDFKIDMNGEKFSWQGVVLLPFIEERLLLDTLKSVYDTLTEEEKKRNITGAESVFIGRHHRMNSKELKPANVGLNPNAKPFVPRSSCATGTQSDISEDQNNMKMEVNSGKMCRNEQIGLLSTPSSSKYWVQESVYHTPRPCLNCGCNFLPTSEL